MLQANRLGKKRLSHLDDAIDKSTHDFRSKEGYKNCNKSTHVMRRKDIKQKCGIRHLTDIDSHREMTRLMTNDIQTHKNNITVDKKRQDNCSEWNHFWNKSIGQEMKKRRKPLTREEKKYRQLVKERKRFQKDFHSDLTKAVFPKINDPKFEGNLYSANYATEIPGCRERAQSPLEKKSLEYGGSKR
jgi:hypothetical protein